MNARRWMIAALLGGWIPAHAASLSCDLKESEGGCYKRVKAEAKVLAAARGGRRTQKQTFTEVEAQLADRLLKRETGLDAAGLASSLKNLLPLASLSSLVGTGGNSDDGGNPIALDLNALVPDLLGGNRVQVSGEADTQPELAKPIEQQLQAAGQGEALERLRGKLDGLDDVAYTFSYSLSTRWWGRDFANYRSRLEALQQRALSAAPATRSDADAIGNAICAEELDCGDRNKQPFTDAKCLKQGCNRDEILGRYMGAVAVSAQSMADEEVSFMDKLHHDGIDRFDRLINNQPQLHLGVTRLDVDPLVGAKATLVKVRFEGGLINVNSVESAASDAGSSCTKVSRDWREDGLSASEGCYNFYRDYIDDHLEQIAAAERVAATFEYADIDDLEVSDAQENISIMIPGSKRYAGELAYGRYLDAKSETRIDGSARYEAYKGDALRAGRWSVSLVITQRIAGVSVPFTLFYRSKGEFESEPEDIIGTMVGLNFDVLPKPAQPASGVLRDILDRVQ